MATKRYPIIVKLTACAFAAGIIWLTILLGIARLEGL